MATIKFLALLLLGMVLGAACALALYVFGRLVICMAQQLVEEVRKIWKK